jgi:hypothetical protein
VPHAYSCIILVPAAFAQLVPNHVAMSDANNDTAGREVEIPVRLSLPLEFQQEIFHELRDEDILLVLARGLGLLRLVTNLLHSYDAAGHNLVILLGADDRENDWIGESLAEHAARQHGSHKRTSKRENVQTWWNLFHHESNTDR